MKNRNQQCCKQLGIVLAAACRNKGLVLSEDGALIWDLGPLVEGAPELESETNAGDWVVRFCPFCGEQTQGAVLAPAVARALYELRLN